MKKTNSEKNKHPKISVVIITKDRRSELRECLTSLVVQTVAPDEVIIVDSSVSFAIKKLVQKFQKRSRFPIRYWANQSHSYGALRNFGIKNTKHSWVAFIDDDCVAELEWFSTMKKVVKSSQAEVYLGLSQTYFQNNLPSLVTSFLDTYWKRRRIDANYSITDFEITDTKNLLVSKTFLTKNNISFHEDLSYGGKGEDCLLGVDLEGAGGTGRFLPSMKVLHKDPITWKQYYLKLYQEVFAYRTNVQNYKKRKIPNNPQLRKVNFTMFFKEWIETYKLNFLERISFGFNIFLTVILIKITKFF